MKTPMELARAIAHDYATINSVQAVVIAGSQTAGSRDQKSDIDLYVYSTLPIALAERERIARNYSSKPEVGNSFWEPGDEWIDSDLKIGVDVMFRSIEWIESQLDRILKRHEASVGYSTCFWHNVLSSEILFDKTGWFRKLRNSVRVPYPDELRRAIIAKNYPILRNTQSSYRTQIERATERNDPVSIQHRLTAFLASYFDILFALNQVPHPGEKRLIASVIQNCPAMPLNFPDGIIAAIRSAGTQESNIIGQLDDLVDGLESLLRESGV